MITLDAQLTVKSFSNKRLRSNCIALEKVYLEGGVGLYGKTSDTTTFP